MGNEFPTLRQLAAVIDNGNDKDHTPGVVCNAMIDCGCDLDDAVDRYSTIELVDMGSGLTAEQALAKHRGYVLLEYEQESYFFKVVSGGKVSPLLVIYKEEVSRLDVNWRSYIPDDLLATDDEFAIDFERKIS